MTTYTMLTAIVPAETVETYRAMAAGLHPAGAGMFITPLYTGEELTHYISTGLIDTVFTDVVTDPVKFAQAAGVSLAEAQALKDGFTHLAVGTQPEDEETPPPLHGKAAIEDQGLSLTPTEDEVE